jgi:hypothetical protein
VRNILSELRFTIVGAVLGIGLILTSALTNFDLVRVNLKLLEGIQSHEVDDIACGIMLGVVGLAIDRVLSRQRKRRRQQAEIEAQKLRTLKATMRTVHDIVNNFLNCVMLFEMPAKGDMDTIEELIRETSERLKALGDLDSVVEMPLAVGIGIEYPRTGTSLRENSRRAHYRTRI